MEQKSANWRGRSYSKSRAALRKNKEKSGKCPIPLFVPGQPYFVYWDVTVMITLLYVAIVTPADVALFGGERSRELIGLGALVDCIFVLDMLIQCNLAYELENGNGYERDRVKIMKRYLSGWFTIDTISVIPFAYITNNDLALLLKLLRLLRYGRILDRWGVLLLSWNVLTKMVTTSGFIVCLVSHWGACFWIIIAKERLGNPTWIDNAEADAGRELLAWDIYARAIHWSVMTLTTVGYGDVAVPANTVEYFLSALYMVLVGAVWAFIIGSSSSVSSLRNQLEMEFIVRLDDLNFFMRSHNFTKEQRSELRTFFHRHKALRHRQRWKDLLPMMSPNLQRDVSLRAHGNLLRRVKYFRRVSDNFLQDLSMMLEFRLFPPGELINCANSLYIVLRGCVMGQNMRIFRKGGHWGDVITINNPHLRSSCLGLALTYVEVAIIQVTDENSPDNSIESLEALLREYPEDKKRLRKVAVRDLIRRVVRYEMRIYKESKSRLYSRRREGKEHQKRGRNMGYESIDGNTSTSFKSRSISPTARSDRKSKRRFSYSGTANKSGSTLGLMRTQPRRAKVLRKQSSLISIRTSEQTAHHHRDETNNGSLVSGNVDMELKKVNSLDSVAEDS